MCVFCNIVSGKIQAKKVFENDKFVGFFDISPLTPGHTLVVPKKHIGNFWDMDDKTAGELFTTVKNVSKRYMEKLKPQRVMLAVIGVDVPHVHVHVIPRYEGDGHGGSINFKLRANISPEEMDKLLQKVKF